MSFWQLILLLWVVIVPLSLLTLALAMRVVARRRRDRPADVGYTRMPGELKSKSTEVPQD